MNYVNLTEAQYKQVMYLIDTYMQGLREKIKRRFNIDVTDKLIIQIIMFMFRSKYNITNLQKLAILLCDNRITKDKLDQFIHLLFGSNMLGIWLRYNNITQHSTYIATCRRISLLKEENIYATFIKNMFMQDSNQELNKMLLSNEADEIWKYLRFLRQYKGRSLYREEALMERRWRFDRDLVGRTCGELLALPDRSCRQEAIVLLDQWRTAHNLLHVTIHSIYQLTQSFISFTDEQFTHLFGLRFPEDVKALVELLWNHSINNSIELNMKANIAKYVEYNKINLKFSKKFNIENISDHNIINMLDTVEHRLLIFGIFGGSQYVIVRRLLDNKIMKRIVLDNNQYHIDNMLQQCNDDHLYDVIIVSNYEYKNVQNIRMRYLNYVYNVHWRNIELALSHPEDLVSLSTKHVKISNMNQCINLKSLCSVDNTYKKQDIEQLYNLKRIYSQYDKYDNEGSCLLEDLFKNSKLVYVYIYDSIFGEKIQIPTLLKQNIENLRFLDANKLKLDISSCCNNVDNLYDMLLKKYIWNQEEYQNLDFYDRQWMIQQITMDQYIKYKQLTCAHDPFDPLSYKARMMNIFLQDHTRQKQEEMLNQLIQDINKYYAIAEANPDELLDVVDVNNFRNLKNYMVFVNNSDNNDLKSKFIKRLYNAFSWDSQINYSILQIIQQLIKIDNEAFKKEFYVENEDDVKTLVNCLIHDSIQNNQQLRQMSAISKYLDCKKIYLEFNENFTLEDIPDDILVHLFDNIDNRIQQLDCKQYQSFIIIHKVSDGSIYKRMIDNNIDEIEDMLQQYQNKELYDIVIKSTHEFHNISNIRIRYLNYINEKVRNQINIIVYKFDDLLSAALQQVTIININECYNLVNLYSKCNMYKKNDIINFDKVKRIYSMDDKYDYNERCFLTDLFEYNIPEYVHIVNIQFNENIMNDVMLQRNISNQRYIYIYQNECGYILRLDVSIEFPNNLAVYDVTSKTISLLNPDLHYFFYGEIQGNFDQVKLLEEKLIHCLRRNK